MAPPPVGMPASSREFHDLKTVLLDKLQAYKVYVHEPPYKVFPVGFELDIEDKYLLVLSLSGRTLIIGTYPNLGQFGAARNIGEGCDGAVSYALSFHATDWLWQKTEVVQGNGGAPFNPKIPTIYKDSDGAVLNDEQMTDYVLKTIVLLMQSPTA
jgi:hypothetical protein